MTTYIKHILLFFTPFLLAIPMEIKLRKNSYQASSNYIQKNKKEIEVLTLGSSHTWRAINPEYLELNTAVLAHGGMGLNINLLLFDKFFPQLPNLKYVTFDMTVGYFENIAPKNSNKSHLFKIYYGINNYHGNIPLKDRFLLTSNTKNYIDILFFQLKKRKNESYNDYGFVTEIPKKYDQFRRLKYDTARIASKFDMSLIRKHSQINDRIYDSLTHALDIAIQRCIDRNVDVILMSTPKYHLYIDNLNPTITDRRNQYLEQYAGHPNVHIWNYENLFRDDVKKFKDVNHLNTEGAELYTKLINERFKDLHQRE